MIDNGSCTVCVSPIDIWLSSHLVSVAFVVFCLFDRFSWLFFLRLVGKVLGLQWGLQGYGVECSD